MSPDAYAYACVTWGASGLSIVNASAQIAVDPARHWTIAPALDGADVFRSQQSLVPALRYYRSNIDSIEQFALPSSVTQATTAITDGFSDLYGGVFATFEPAEHHCFSNLLVVRSGAWMEGSLAPFARELIVKGCKLDLMMDQPLPRADVLLLSESGSLRSVRSRLVKDGFAVDSHTLDPNGTFCDHSYEMHVRASTPVVVTIHGSHETALVMLGTRSLVIEIQTRNSHAGAFCGAFGSRMVLLTHSIHRGLEPFTRCRGRAQRSDHVMTSARGGVFLSPDEVATISRLVGEHMLIE